MSKTDRREFLKQAGAGLVGAALSSTAAVRAEPPADESAPPSLPPHRGLELQGVHAYADQQSVEAGGKVSFHVSATESYKVSIVRLGHDVDGPNGDQTIADLPDAPPRVQKIHPGSYVLVEKGLPADEPIQSLGLECWVRTWRTGRLAALISQFDRPERCGFGLFLNADGGIAFYLGSGPFRQECWQETAPAGIAAGRWHHVAAGWDGREKTVFLDGREIGRWPFAGPAAAGASPLRLAGAGEGGFTDRFLDGDLALPAIFSSPLTADEANDRFRRRGMAVPNREGLLAGWTFSEEKGELAGDWSPHRRQGRIINSATWMVGGPSFDGGAPRFGPYDPSLDADRGHALRFAADDLYDCRWEATRSFTLPEDARPGVYSGRLRYRMQGQDYTSQVTFIVKRHRRAARAPILLLLASNTWRAYNSAPFAKPQPGWRHLCDTNGMPNSPGDPPAYSFYRGHAGGQGTYQVGSRIPWPAAGPYIRYGDQSDYSHLLRADRCTQVWLEKSGYRYDPITDLDLHRDPELPREYRAVVVCGHSEYWSIPMYEGLRRYLEHGGNLLCLSGNSLFWRVSFNEDGTILECRKVDAGGDQVPAERRGECWHSQDGLRGGLLAECGYPGWKLVGLTTLGWNNPNRPDHFSPFLIEDPDHFLFRGPERLEVKKGDPIGQAPAGGMPRANGHEVDVRLSTLKGLLREPLLPGAVHPDDPPGIQLLAASRGWPKDAMTFDCFLRPVRPESPVGGELIYWERPEGGRVLNAGAIAAGWTLLVDPLLQGLVRNALHHFGVPRPG